MPTWFSLKDLQAKVIFILIMVIIPTSFLLTLAQSKFMVPVLYDEMKQVGVSFAQSLAGQVESNHLLSKPNVTVLLEDYIQRSLYAHPSISRVDIYGQSAGNKAPLVYLASSVEDAESNEPPVSALVEKLTSELTNEDDVPVWSILYPIKGGKANIHILVPLRLVANFQNTILKINFIGAIVSTILLIMLLSFFLRRVIDNEKQLKVAQLSNEVLSGRLQEIQQELIHKERLAVMGQLTASFAHEIGTPLNAIGGHMQLLNMDFEKTLNPQQLKPTADRMEIISGQLKKIELIVKGFLKRTKTSVQEQRQMTSVKQMIERVSILLMPTFQRHQIDYIAEFKAEHDQIEVVPIEIEQVILNLFNNGVDSMKDQVGPKSMTVRTQNDPGKKWLSIEVQDTGTGITEDHLKRVFKPFFTTKVSGEGHGLGLSICQEIIRSYGGEIILESKINRGTLLRVQLPLSGVSNT